MRSRHARRFLSPVNLNKRRQRKYHHKVKVYRQIHPQAGETSLDIDSTKL